MILTVICADVSVAFGKPVIVGICEFEPISSISHPENDRGQAVIDFHVKKQKNEPVSTYHREMRNIIGDDDSSGINQKMMIWLGACAGFLVITGIVALVFRRQVRKKTTELINNQQVLETEIIARRRAEEKYRSIFENTGAATILIEEDMTFSMVNENATRLLGYSREEIEGKMKTGDFIKGESFEMVREYHLSRRRPDSNAPTEFEAQLMDKNGNIKDIYFRVGMIPETQISIASLINITEKKRTESQLVQAQKMEAIGTLAGGIAHDFNNILMGIIGYAQLAISDIGNSEKTKERLERIVSAGARAKELTGQILMFNRKGEQKQEIVQLNAIVDETLKLIRATTPTTIHIDTIIAAVTASVLADPAQIQQIIMNLCTNAVHAMGGEVGVLTAKLESLMLDSGQARQFVDLSPGQYVRLTISDTGHGMTRTVQKQMFDPFFTTKKNGQGTGMGLSVVHGIVKRLHGEITVKSELGNGAVFQVYIPEVANKSPVTALLKAVAPTGTERILLVDDEENVVEVAGQMLRSLGYSVITDTVSRHALWVFMKNPHDFDLVISDQTMPGMTGMEMFKKILSVRPDLPFILSTGFSETVTQESALTEGVRELIMKPYFHSELAAVVRRALDPIVSSSTASIAGMTTACESESRTICRLSNQLQVDS